jgi:hypothetical protein
MGAPEYDRPQAKAPTFTGFLALQVPCRRYDGVLTDDTAVLHGDLIPKAQATDTIRAFSAATARALSTRSFGVGPPPAYKGLDGVVQEQGLLRSVVRNPDSRDGA